MSITFDFPNTVIEIDDGQTTLDMQDLINDIRTAEASGLGIDYQKIANASGKESLGGAVSVGITVELQNGWQIHFEAGNYIAEVGGGNLVGGPGGDPIAYSAGVQVLLLQSAAATVVETGTSGLTPTESQALIDAKDAAEAAEASSATAASEATGANTAAQAAETAALSAETAADAASANTLATKAAIELQSKYETNRAVIVNEADGSQTITIYDDDKVTPIHIHTVNIARTIRDPV